MNKAPDAFRTISEVAEDLDLPQHVLRFWETRFPPIRPLKRGGGRRYYRPDDVELLKGIRQLLYGQGYTIKGVQRILKEGGARYVQGIGRGELAAGPMHEEPSDLEDMDLPDMADSPARGAERSFEPAGQSQPQHDDRQAGGYGRDNQASLPAGDIDRLRSALEELIECERVLASLRRSDDTGR